MEPVFILVIRQLRFCSKLFGTNCQRQQMIRNKISYPCVSLLFPYSSPPSFSSSLFFFFFLLFTSFLHSHLLHLISCSSFYQAVIWWCNPLVYRIKWCVILFCGQEAQYQADSTTLLGSLPSLFVLNSLVVTWVSSLKSYALGAWCSAVRKWWNHKNLSFSIKWD